MIINDYYVAPWITLDYYMLPLAINHYLDYYGLRWVTVCDFVLRWVADSYAWILCITVDYYDLLLSALRHY